MRNKNKDIFANHHLWWVTIIMVASSLLYYLPTIAGFAGWTSAQNMLGELHNFYGIDFYSLAFFAPVVYAAYVFGVIGALLAAFIAMLILLPYSILIDTYPNALFKPTAFVIILSAVGAVVAMLQTSDEQRRRSVKELKCLYDVGKSAEESLSVEQLLSSVVGLIPQAMPYPEETGVRIAVRDKMFHSPDFEESSHKITEDLVVGGEVLGSVEIHFNHNNAYLTKQNHLIKTLAERIGGAVREIELEQSLRGYYEQLEEMVENRTRDLEQVQEKLIRSERLAAVGELASGVGHELRNPLNVIRNCVYLLHLSMGDRADEDVQTTLNVLDKQIDISNRIVTDLLDFTRIKPPSLSKVDLNSLVKESLSWITVPDSAEVATKLVGKSPQVKIDSEQVGRAFANIISNALQAMNSHGELKISTGVNNGSAWVKFVDNGCGIPKENLEKIFEPLFTTKPKGIGLGLAITKRLIEQNKGTIEIASHVSKGTTFTIKLPIKKERGN
ncbi:sensor histidine kinase [Chloroflexota bacterium]